MKYHGVVLLIGLIAISYLCHLVKCEIFSAIVDFEPLLHTEGAVAKALGAYIEQEEERLREMKRIKDGFQKLHEKANEDHIRFLANPVNAFLVVKHLTVDWVNARNLMIDRRSNAAMAQLVKFNFPDPDDVKGTADGIFRLQDTYHLNTTDLADGRVRGAHKSIKMTAHDCFGLGYSAYQTADYYHAGLWLEETLKRIDDEQPASVKKSLVLEYLAHMYFLIQDVRRATQITKQILKEDPHNHVHENLELFSKFLKPDEWSQLDQSDPALEAESLTRIHELKPPLDPSFGDYDKLCRGEKVKTPKEEKNLYCRYTSKNSSYMLLQPAKEEVLSLKPRIVVYHDIISDKDAQLIKDLALPNLSRATVRQSENAKEISVNYRVSKVAWVLDESHPRIPRLNRVMEALLGLSSATAEPIHVINYGIGGHYEPHVDFRRNYGGGTFLELERGDRIATWIYYLSDVDAGGSTVFPHIGVEVKAEKGAAAVWYNLWRNGTGDKSTVHAACPVLSGSKWVANKWFHEITNEFKRPCALEQNL